MTRPVSPEDPAGATWREVAALADSPRGTAVAFCWGFAEALSWPVIAEMELAVIGAAAPRRTPRHAVALAAGSVAGVVTHAWLRRRGVRPPLPMTTSRMSTEVRSQLAAEGARAFWRQLFNAVPVKVYAAEAAATDLTLAQVAAGAGAARGSRVVGVGLVATGLSRFAHPLARRHWGAWMAISLAGWALGVRALLRRWR